MQRTLLRLANSSALIDMIPLAARSSPTFVRVRIFFPFSLWHQFLLVSSYRIVPYYTITQPNPTQSMHSESAAGVEAYEISTAWCCFIFNVQPCPSAGPTMHVSFYSVTLPGVYCITPPSSQCSESIQDPPFAEGPTSDSFIYPYP